MKKVSIQIKILSLIFITLLLTITGVIYLTYHDQREDLLQERDKNINVLSRTLNTSLRNMMLDGEAPIMVKTMEQLRDLPEYKQIAIYRTDGKLAFSDYMTLDKVNAYQKKMNFKQTPRIQDMRSMDARMHDMQYIDEAVAKTRKIQNFFNDTKEKEYFFPITTEGACLACHEKDAGNKRGVIHIRLSVKNIYDTIDENRKFLIIFFASVGLFILIVIFMMLRGMIIKPVLKMEETVGKVGQGDFQARVDIHRNDEIGELGDRIDQMTRGLEERFKLSKYVSKSTDRLVKGEIDAGEGGDSKEITVLFSDVRGFTSYSEAHSPEEVITNLNRLLEVQAEIVHAEGGDVDKFVGDELMAVFDDPHAAVRSAVKMVNAVLELDKEIQQGLRIGIGLNSGKVVAGNIGSASRKEYAVIGDTVNVGARLCSAAPPSTVYISEDTYALVRELVDVELIENQTVKGKQKALNFYRVRSVK